MLTIDHSINAPKNAEDALRVVRLEAQLRLSEEYMAATKPYVSKFLTPPIDIDRAA